MDISKIDDTKELKALAYDELAQIETLQKEIGLRRENVRMINTRIAQVDAEKSKTAQSKKS